MKEFINPIIKIYYNNKLFVFFTIPDFKKWAEGKNLKGSKIKYYKGLGTSSANEAKEYFFTIDYHQIEFEY